KSNVLEKMHEKLISQAISEGFITDDTVAIDATHFEARDQAQPKECEDCPLATEGICQKVFKMKITKDLRKYTAPARGSKAWQKIYNKRTAVERVNAYLKEFFQLNNVRYRSGRRAKIHFDIVTLMYNA